MRKGRLAFLLLLSRMLAAQTVAPTALYQAPPPFARECPVPADRHASDMPVGAQDSIELRRTICFGTCPAYSVRVYGDGTIDWHGDAFVVATGSAEAKIPSGDAKALIRSAQEQGFPGLCAYYSRSITDAPHVKVSLRIGDATWSVDDYASSAPQWLQQLETDIDRVADTHRWRHGDPTTETFGEWRTREDAQMPKPGVTPLMRAATHPASEVRALLAAGGNPNAKDASGWTALMYAAQSGRFESMKLLIARGADPAQRTFAGETILFAAATAESDAEEKLRFLCAAGVDVNAQDKTGNTALMVAARGPWHGTIPILLELGARRDLRNEKGESALDVLNQTPSRRRPDNFGESQKLLQP